MTTQILTMTRGIRKFLGIRKRVSSIFIAEALIVAMLVVIILSSFGTLV